MQVLMNTGMKIGLAIIGIGAIVFAWFYMTEGFKGGWMDAWIYVPCCLWIIGSITVVISFFIRGNQLNWEL